MRTRAKNNIDALRNDWGGLFADLYFKRLLFCAAVQGVSSQYDKLWSPRWPTKVNSQVQK